ncbi:MAG: adenosine kinase [Alphaproteobacteria bacterium]|nr:adenosine kinase [Alphaproteobacteria bacterium]
MTETTETNRFDVVAIGNAIVDVLASIEDDDFLVKHNMPKGMRTLVDAVQAEELYQDLKGKSVECSGGSAANTVVGIAKMGGRPAFIGKVACDELGDYFRDDIQKVGVDYSTPCLKFEKPTARCMVIVSKDGQRTMNTYLGACAKLSSEDIDAETIKNSQVVYMEGYLWDRDEAKDALSFAVKVAKENNKKTSLSLSDPFCVRNHRESFIEFIKSGIDIVFCNEEECKSLFNTRNLEEAFKQCENLCETVVVTCGADGAYAIHNKQKYHVKAAPIKKVVDTTGAGDSFAAGFLACYTRNGSIEHCLSTGAAAAAEMISHVGARPQADISNLIENSKP